MFSVDLIKHLLYVRIFYAFSVLSVFSIYDVKYRDIPDKYVWFSLFVSIALFALTVTLYVVVLDSLQLTLLILYIVFSFITGVGVFVLIYRLGFIGKADVFVIAELTLLFPYVDVYDFVVFRHRGVLHLPPVIPIVLYSNIISLLFIVFKSMVFSVIYRKFIPKDLPLRRRALLVIFGRPMSVSKFLLTKHYYPLTLIRLVDGNVVKTHRLTFKVEEEDYRVHQENLRELVSRGYIKPEEVIWVTYGVPYMLPLLITMVLFLLIGDYPLQLLFKRLP